MTTIATWNVNSIRVRLEQVISWIDKENPDILLLQELKTIDTGFPYEEFETRGYNIAINGQKSYNGVAILSKSPLEDINKELPGDKEDSAARYIEAVTKGMRIISVYVPNGQSVSSDKYQYKLKFLERLYKHLKELLFLNEISIIGGDFNIAPEDIDVHDPEEWKGHILFSLEERKALRKILYLGYWDAFRALHPKSQEFTWWDYREGAWQKNHGLRIDHLLLSPMATDKLQEVKIDRSPRGETKASDHTPIWCRVKTNS